MANIYSWLASGAFIYFLLVFLAFSYGIVALMTWSPLKPLKYLGFPTIVVGVVGLITQNGFTQLLPELLEGVSEKVAVLVIDHGISYFMWSSIMCIVIGILMEVLYFTINGLLKKKKDKTTINEQD